MAGYEAKYISGEPILTEEQKEKFREYYNLTSDSQETYGQVLLRIMKKGEISPAKAERLTGLNRSLFSEEKLKQPGGSVLKRFVVSIGVGFNLDVHLTEYLLELCGMKFNESNYVDKAYIYVLEECKEKNIKECNTILKELGVTGKDLLGELERSGGEYSKNNSK